jgi:hypothetical protein
VSWQVLQTYLHKSLLFVLLYHVRSGCFLTIHLALCPATIASYQAASRFCFSGWTHATMIGDAIEPAGKARLAAKAHAATNASRLISLASLSGTAAIEDVALIPSYEQSKSLLISCLTGFHELVLISS